MTRKRTAAMRQDVLVVGGGRAGRETARLVTGMGYPATLVEDFTTLVSLTGRTGDFEARLCLPGKKQADVRWFGAVVVAPEPEKIDPQALPFVSGRVVPLASLESHVENLPRREKPREIAIVLDYSVDEDTESCEAAFRAALAVRAFSKSQVTVVLRDARVAARGMESLYNEARQAGVMFLKHSGAPVITVQAGQVTVSFRDAVTGREEAVSCGLAAVSEAGLAPRGEQALAAAAGLSVDGYGRVQENNVHLLPTQTNRAGVFVVRSEGRAAHDAAFSVHALLSSKLVIEPSTVIVDGEKCALCLTCVRVCPFKAMRIDEAQKKADCIPENCRRCGICAAECPARAITLPLYPDDVILANASTSPGAGR